MRICLIVNLDRNNHSNIPSKIEHNCFQIRNLTVQTTILMRICAYARYIYIDNICMRISALFKRNWAFRCHWRCIHEWCACTCMHVHVSARVCVVVDGDMAVEDAPNKRPIRSSIWVKIYTRHVHTCTRTHTHTHTRAHTHTCTHTNPQDTHTHIHTRTHTPYVCQGKLEKQKYRREEDEEEAKCSL